MLRSGGMRKPCREKTEISLKRQSEQWKQCLTYLNLLKLIFLPCQEKPFLLPEKNSDNPRLPLTFPFVDWSTKLVQANSRAIRQNLHQSQFRRPYLLLHRVGYRFSFRVILSIELLKHASTFNNSKPGKWNMSWSCKLAVSLKHHRRVDQSGKVGINWLIEVFFLCAQLFVC